MKKLTKTQQEIIKRLTDEFLSINNATPTKPSGLINVAEIIGDFELKRKAILEVTANNTEWNIKADNIAEKEYNLIKADIESLNIPIKLEKRTANHYAHIIIGEILSDTNAMRLTYRLYGDTDKIACIRRVNSFKRESYLHSPHKENIFISFEAFTQDEVFKRKIKILYEKYNK